MCKSVFLQCKHASVYTNVEFMLNVCVITAVFCISNSLSLSFVINLCACHDTGGRLGRKGWGDDFIKVLVSAVVSTNGIRLLRRLGLQDIGVSSEGKH